MDFKTLIGYQDFSTLRQTALGRLKAAGSRITNLNVGGAFRTLLELAMQGIADLFNLLLAVVPMGYAANATGGWLDLKAGDVGLTRKPAIKAAGLVTFGRGAPGGAVTVPTGSIVKTDPLSSGQELRFRVTADTVMLGTTVDVPVEAEFAGAVYNVGTGAILHLVTYIAGVDTVTNPEDWMATAGADTEDDDSLRARYFLQWESKAQGGTAAAYESWALSVPGVISARCDDSQPRGPGTVDVVVSGAAGAPTTQLLADVQAVIDLNKPLTDDALALGPTEVPINYDVTLYLPAVGGDPVVVEAEAQTRIDALHMRNQASGIAPVEIGRSVFRARLTALLMFSPVVDVGITSPAVNVVIDPGQLATKGTVHISVLRVSA